MDEYQNYVMDKLWNSQFGGMAKVNILEYNGNYAISFKTNKNYFGTIYPMRALIKDKTFKKSYDIDEIVNYFRCKNKLYKNIDVCNTCKKLKLYPNVYLLAL